MQFIRQEQQFRKELKAVLSNINPREMWYTEHPDVLALLDKWVEDNSRDLDIERLETILEEEVQKLESASDNADAGPYGQIQ